MLAKEDMQGRGGRGRGGIVRGNGMSVEECQGSGMVFDSVQYGHSSMGRIESHCTVKTPSAMTWQGLMLQCDMNVTVY